MAAGDLAKTVGRNLRGHRQRLGVSQEAFAQQLGYHRTYMGGLERGERNLTLGTLEHIADRLRIDPLTLLGVDADEQVAGTPRDL